MISETLGKVVWAHWQHLGISEESRVAFLRLGPYKGSNALSECLRTFTLLSLTLQLDIHRPLENSIEYTVNMKP